MSGSSSLMSSPEGSEVACSEGFCNHERGDCLDINKNDKLSLSGFTLSLQEMLMVSLYLDHCSTHSLILKKKSKYVFLLIQKTCTSDEEDNASYIPIEDVMEFKSRRNTTEKRQELRQNLRQKFAQLCVAPPTLTAKEKQSA